MKTLFFLLICFCLFSFRPVPEKIANNARTGFYIQVKDLTDRTSHQYIVDSKDSVNDIFASFFNSELELGDVDRPISIYNGKRDFYIARVTVYVKPNGKKDFKHLKYPKVYVKPEKNKRSKLKPVIL
ncbi:MAG: hypothetical protein WC384_11250 [Prolixibacteraceae bacterium]|jgi:hypothetical protein